MHSWDTFGTHDGPGIRFVLFLQGCPGRCLYCQNPDTWPLKGGKLFPADKIFEKVKFFLPYMQASGGGVTVSGGEPLLQVDFLIDFFKLCCRAKIHTCIDTAGLVKSFSKEKLFKLFKVTDLFLLDIKAITPSIHQKICGFSFNQTEEFLNQLEQAKKPYWLRYVLVPGINDSAVELKKLKALVKPLQSCQNIEFLPYHALGKHKWEALKIPYPLKNTRSATQKDISRAQGIVGLVKKN